MICFIILLYLWTDESVRFIGPYKLLKSVLLKSFDSNFIEEEQGILEDLIVRMPLFYFLANICGLAFSQYLIC